MKRLKYAVILLLGLSMATAMMTSCKKDNTQLIVGKWKPIEETPIHSGGDYWYLDTDETYVFMAEGLTTFPDVYFTLPYEINGNSLILDEDEVFNIDQLTSSTMKLSNTKYPNDPQIVLKKVE